MSILETCRPRSCRWCLPPPASTAEQAEQIRAAAQEMALLWSPSMSLAVNLAMKLHGVAAARAQGSPQGADVEIIERHHRFKEDAPSGTALKFGEIVAARDGPKQAAARARRPARQRPHGEIGYHAVRTGDNPGEHTIIFGLLGETLEITSAPPIAIATPTGRWPPPSFWPASPRAVWHGDVLGLSE